MIRWRPFRDESSHRSRVFALSAVPFLAVPLLAGAVGSDAPSVAAAASPGTSVAGPTNPASAQLELDEPATITLVTGDRVTLHPNGSVDIEPGPGRDDIVFDEQNVGEEIHVVPSDAKKLLNAGELDRRLFNITYLVREGYGDAQRAEMPLIIEGKADDVREVAKGRGADVKKLSPKLKMSVVAQSKKKNKGSLWSRVTGDDETPESLPAGVDKIWLDGTAHLTLDESVPQIGAPEAWDAGYTGEGVTVAVLDSGVDSTHPDLADQVVAEKSFVDSPLGGAFVAEALGYALPYRIVFGAASVPTSGSSDSLVDVGRACVESEGDELDANPTGKTALIIRGSCTFAEKYDAAVEAGASGIVFYNNEPGIVLSGIDGAEHAGEVWAANISDADGQALLDVLGDDEITLAFTDNFVGDLHGHGTHVASTIAGTGVAADGSRKGVAPDANLMNGRVCDASGSCQDSWIIAGMEWAAENGADIINMSLGGAPGDGTDPLSQAVNTLTEQHNVLFVVSAGNSGELGLGSVLAPGTADAALTVGAVDGNDKHAWFSAMGPRRGDDAVKPEITAPGVHIAAARAAGTSLCKNTCIQPGDGPVNAMYTAASGTSMAAPHVAGSAALLLQARPELDALGLKNAMVSTAEDTGNLWVEQGTGRIDVARAVFQGLYADGALNFGRHAQDDAPVERQITYTNYTDRVVSLGLDVSIADTNASPADGIRLSRRRVTIRPGDTEVIVATLDPPVLESSGSYGGVITATARDVAVRTAVGFGIERTFIPLEDNWEESWAQKYDYFSSGGLNRVQGGVLTPDGSQLIVTGSEVGPAPRVTVASIDTTSGQEVWRSDVAVFGVTTDSVSGGVAISPDGSRVYVTEDILPPDRTHREIMTIAYNNKPPQSENDPALGEVLWQSRYATGFSQFANTVGGQAMAVSADGSKVLVVGSVTEDGFDNSQAVLIAYNAVTGAEEWVSRYGTPPLTTRGHDIAIHPTEDVAYVTGFEKLEPGEVDVRPVTIAYALSGGAAGEPLWITKGDSVTGNYDSWHNEISDDGKRVFVASTVQVDDAPFDERMSIQAYDSKTGDEIWSEQFGAAEHGFSPGHTEPPRRTRGSVIAVSPQNDLMFVTGMHCEGGQCNGGYVIVTVAYNQSTGERVWFRLHEGLGRPLRGGGSAPSGQAAQTSTDGSQLYVTGACCWTSTSKDDGERVVLAYDTATGELVATARHQFANGPDDHWGAGESVLVDPQSNAIYTVSEIRDGDSNALGASAFLPPIAATATADKVRGSWRVDIEWSVPGSGAMDIHRDDQLVATVGGGTTYTDELGRQRPGTIVEYRVCASETRHCSKPAIVELSVGRPPAVE